MATKPKVELKKQPVALSKKRLLDKINAYTNQLNNPSLPVKEQHRLRTKRALRMKEILPMVNSDEMIFLVPFCHQPIYVSKQIAIIGNAAEILGRKQGEIINKFSTVIRFNSGITKGYETDVGKNTTHLFCTKDYYNNKSQRKSADGQVCKICLDTNELRDLSVIGIVVDKTKLKSLTDNKQFHSSVVKSAYFKNMVLQNNTISYFNPKLTNKLKFTAGLSITISLIDLGLTPHLFGFSHTLNSKYRTYYWPKIIRDKKTNKSHDFAKEYKVLEYLKNKKLIVFH